MRADLTIPERVRAVYQEVWHEFYDWEQEYCLQTLASLVPTINGNSLHAEDSEAPREEPEVSEDGATYVEVDCVEVSSYKANGDIHSETLSCPTYTCGSIAPAQPYEACTYTHKNLYIADDQCEKLPFIPFADEPRFPVKELLDCYDSTGWENPAKDPDYDVIAAEAVRRLHYRFGIPFAAIDETGILPAAIIERPDKKGLLHILNQRDMLPWTGSINSDLPPLPQTDTPLPTSLRQRVNGIRYLFCANLNCVEPYCPTHLNLDEQLKRPIQTYIDGDEKGKRDPPCGYECYKYNSDEPEHFVDWDEATVEDFKFMLESAADLSSCDLAVMCDKPCRELYAHRRIHTSNRPDNDESSSEEEEADGSDSDSLSSPSDEKPIFYDVVRGPQASGELPPSEICQHLGECDSQADCRCFRKKLHCHRNCRCELSCRRRPRGCYCKTKSKQKRCGTSKCPCYRAGRECDPELCKGCSAKDLTQKGGCRNNGLQHGVSKALEVKDGAYGLGLFLLEVAREGDLIGEYVGEILSNKMADARGVLTRHLGRNYLFGLNEAWTIDASLAGNEMRFINHATGSLANCRAEVREVNGDHRIGIYTVKKIIQPGEELFMDYGKEYFTSAPVGGTPRAESTR